MFDNFDIQRVALGGPIFDTEKLSWLNGLWLRELDASVFADKFAAWGLSKDRLMPLVPHVQTRVDTFADVVGLAGHFLGGMTVLTEEDFAHKNLVLEQQVEILQFALWQLESIRHWNRDQVQRRMFALASSMGIKPKDFLNPLFISIAGTSETISVLDSMDLLGPDMSRARLRHAINVLGGVGKKKLKKLEKSYRGHDAAVEAALIED